MITEKTLERLGAYKKQVDLFGRAFPEGIKATRKGLQQSQAEGYQWTTVIAELTQTRRSFWEDYINTWLAEEKSFLEKTWPLHRATAKAIHALEKKTGQPAHNSPELKRRIEEKHSQASGELTTIHSKKVMLAQYDLFLKWVKNMEEKNEGKK